MKSIPAEIAIQIFHLLHQRDKLQCMLVCHEWESVIKSAVLFETLSISSKEGLDSILSSVQQDPSYGLQVKRLLFQVVPGSDFDITILPNLFPNVAYCYINPSIRIPPQLHPFHAWHNKLKQCFESVLDDIGMVIKLNIWPNITTLQLIGHERDLYAKSYLPLLQNTPGLITLKLRAMIFGMDDFEFIHSNLSTLKSLSLVSISYDGSDPPADIIPASSLTFLSVECITRELLFRKRLFFYISRKYQNVSDVFIYVGDLLASPNITANGRYDEWDDVLINLGSRLKKLDLRLANEYECDYVLNSLDKIHCQLESLSIPSKTTPLLSKINLVRCLKSFKIIGSWCFEFAWLSSMTMLTELELVNYNDQIPVNVIDLLTMCGENLQSLIFRSGNVSCVSKTENDTFPVFSKIKKLEFTYAQLPSNIGTFITRSFPQLHTLKFECCFGRDEFEGTEVCFNLPNTNIHYLQIIDDIAPDRYVSVQTLCNNTKRMYTAASVEETDYSLFEEHFGLQDAAVYPPAISIDYEAKSVSPFMTIICNSLKDIFLLDM